MDARDYWIELSDGSRWYPGRDDNEVSLDNLANSLSKLCRFTGHGNKFYSVAEHSVKVSYLTESLTGLMHDAHEALVNDIAKPVKVYLSGSYKELEDRAEEQIAKQYSLEYPHPKEVKHYDVVMCLIEAFDLLPSKGKEWGYYEEYVDEARQIYVDRPEVRVEGWNPDEANQKFRERYYELYTGSRPINFNDIALLGGQRRGLVQQSLASSLNAFRAGNY